MPNHPSRRTLLRTGATAAWTAPVIVAATSVPAFAASPGPVETLTANWNDSYIENTGTFFQVFIDEPSVVSSVDLAPDALTLLTENPGGTFYGSQGDFENWYWTSFGSPNPTARMVYSAPVQQGVPVILPNYEDGATAYTYSNAPSGSTWKLYFQANGVVSNPLVLAVP